MNLNVISDHDKKHLWAFSYLHKRYEQSGAGVDFVSTYEKIVATGKL